MISVQSSLQPAVKDQVNPESQSRYATLNSVMEACRKTLIDNDIWLTQYPILGKTGHLGLVTKLTHVKSGQWQTSCLHMPLPQDDPQGYGSAMTYARRYSISALLGMITEVDDDGNAASKQKNSSSPDARATVTQSKTDNPPSADAALKAMPKLDGVNYSIGQQNGQQCILANGDTYRKKSILSKSGFKWDEQQKVWWRYANAA